MICKLYIIIKFCQINPLHVFFVIEYLFYQRILVSLQQQFLPRLFLKAYHGRTSCFIKVICNIQSKQWILTGSSIF